MTAPGPSPEWQLFSPEEAAPLLRMSRAKMYRLLAGKNPLPHRVIGGQKFLHTQDIDAILALGARGKR